MKIKNTSSSQKRILARAIATALFFTFVIVFNSCKKEAISGKDQAAPSALDRSNAVSTINFGAQTGEPKKDDNVTIFNMLGVNYIRWEISLKDFTGFNDPLDTYVSKGYKVILNLNYDNAKNANGTSSPKPFPTDMVAYTNLLKSVLDKYHPELVVIENEAWNDAYHSGPIENYITELTTAVNVCKSYGIKVADSGLGVRYAQQVMNGNSWNTDPSYIETKKMIDAFKTMGLDYINIHVIVPFGNLDNPNTFPSDLVEPVADYLRSYTGKEVMSNEYDQTNQSASLMQGAVAAFTAGGYKYMVARSNKAGGKNSAQPLYTKVGTLFNLTTIGSTYRDAIK